MRNEPRTPKSWSHFETADQCPLAYKFRYVDKVKFKKPEAMTFGTAFHEFRYRYYSHLAAEHTDSDWGAVKAIAKATFHDKDMPMNRWDEFLDLCDQFARNRLYNGRMQVEIKFGVNRDLRTAPFDEADYFRGIIDGLEIKGDVGIITDAKTARSTKLSFAQLRIYAAFMALEYPAVKEWKLIYDFTRLNHTEEETVLSESLREIRDHIRIKVEKIENQKSFPPAPGEHCMECPFLGRCHYAVMGLKRIRNEKDAKVVMEDYWFTKAKAAQMKRMLKAYVDDHEEIETKNLKAGFFPKFKISCDKRNLIKLIKSYKRDPVEYIDFPPRVLHQLRKDKNINEDAANFIFLEPRHSFEVKKAGKVIEKEPEETQDD